MDKSLCLKRRHDKSRAKLAVRSAFPSDYFLLKIERVLYGNLGVEPGDDRRKSKRNALIVFTLERNVDQLLSDKITIQYLASYNRKRRFHNCL